MNLQGVMFVDKNLHSQIIQISYFLESKSRYQTKKSTIFGS
jgi:hypothetical protein